MVREAGRLREACGPQDGLWASSGVRAGAHGHALASLSRRKRGWRLQRPHVDLPPPQHGHHWAPRAGMKSRLEGLGKKRPQKNYKRVFQWGQYTRIHGSHRRSHRTKGVHAVVSEDGGILVSQEKARSCHVDENVMLRGRNQEQKPRVCEPCTRRVRNRRSRGGKEGRVARG